VTDDDCLKLTTYFGERDQVASPSRSGRGRGRLLADVLAEIYGEHQVQTSVLLRGSEGFGSLNHLHTDRLLSLSEDLPVLSVAVDRRKTIEAMLEPLLATGQRGLITLERARLLSGDIGEVTLPESLHEATKLTVYVGRQERAGGVAAYAAVCELLHREGIAGATVLLGVDGTRHGRRTRASFFGRNATVPMMIIAVGEGKRIAGALPKLGELLDEPLLTLERIRVCKRDGQILARPHELPGTDEHGLAMWQKLMVYSSQAATRDGRPLSLEIIRRLRRTEAAGATNLRGIWGFHGDHPPHGDRFLQLRRHVPVVTITIDTPERTAAAFEIIDELTDEQGLVTSEMVPALGAVSADGTIGGFRLARHDF
jgi:PII-like signaling protein